MKGIQCFGPTRRPIAADIGWNITNVMKNKETDRFRSEAAAPMSVVKPGYQISPTKLSSMSKSVTDPESEHFRHCLCQGH